MAAARAQMPEQKGQRAAQLAELRLLLRSVEELDAAREAALREAAGGAALGRQYSWDHLAVSQE